jgi:hypothetical protein
MRINRRDFLACAGAVAMGPGLDPWPAGRVFPTGLTGPVRVLLDLSEQGGLGESIAGYETALSSMGEGFVRVGPGSLRRCEVVILPAATKLRAETLAAIALRLEAGAVAMLESGAAFGTASEFAAQRAMLRDHLGVHIEAPVDLWAGRPAPRAVPYIDYTWPQPATVRDFSRVVPLGAPTQPGELIASVEGRPVALRRRCGRGTLLFLGSPLGPALWAGDAQARRWLQEALSAFIVRFARASHLT